MNIDHQVKMKVQLRPIGQPWVRIGVSELIQECQLETVTEFDYDFNATGTVALTVEHFGKSDIDPTTAVEIVRIEFFGISDPKFVWAGTYYPEYPTMWYSEQSTKPADVLPNQTYLGWNGVYKLEFTVPVFTWIHQVQDLGWIYV